MGRPKPAKPRLPPESLRLKFWEIAGHGAYDGYETPFHKIRVERGKTVGDLSEWLCMNLDDYIRMEQGDLTPRATDILSFCKVMYCSPLDLYNPVPYVDTTTPLPRVILESLVALMDDDDFDSVDQEAALSRLRSELMRGRSVIRNNVEALRPLLLSLGFTPDLRSYKTPLYSPPPREDMVVPGENDDVANILNNGVNRKRLIMDNSLLILRSQMEAELGTRPEILEGIKNDHKKNREALKKSAVILYGKKGAETATEAMAARNDRGTYRRNYIANPGGHYPLSAAAPKNAEELKWHAEDFIDRITMDEKLQAARTKAEKLLNDISARCTAFDEWQDLPATQKLFDWFENWAILYDLPKVNTPNYDPRNGPGQHRDFPMLPK